MSKTAKELTIDCLNTVLKFIEGERLDEIINKAIYLHSFPDQKLEIHLCNKWETCNGDFAHFFLCVDDKVHTRLFKQLGYTDTAPILNISLKQLLRFFYNNSLTVLEEFDFYENNKDLINLYIDRYGFGNFQNWMKFWKIASNSMREELVLRSVAGVDIKI